MSTNDSRRHSRKKAERSDRSGESYTARELERATGFDLRTIAYYVQKGLLPRVGRRGPRTRYPRLVRDRLLFIRRVREAERAGEVPPVSLKHMSRLFKQVPRELVASVADEKTPVTPEIVSLQPTGAISPESSTRPRFAESRQWRGDEVEALSSLERPSWAGFPARRPAPDGSYCPPDPKERTEQADLIDILVDLQEAAAARRVRSPRSIGAPQVWSRVKISADITVSVRGISADDQLLTRLGEMLRRLLLGRKQERLASRDSDG